MSELTLTAQLAVATDHIAQLTAMLSEANDRCTQLDISLREALEVIAQLTVAPAPKPAPAAPAPKPAQRSAAVTLEDTDNLQRSYDEGTPIVRAPRAPRGAPAPVITRFTDRNGRTWEKTRIGNRASLKDITVYETV